jgi:enamine deaminase RidA (YjgF/YER057c/UK114 family)
VSLERVNPETLPAARGFSHAVVSSGRIAHLAGQTALGGDGRIVAGDVVVQFEQALANLLAALAACGGRPDQLASLTVYVVDIVDYRSRSREIGAVWRRLAGRDYPAMAAVEISRLWDADALVELQGTAVVDAGPTSTPATPPSDDSQVDTRDSVS